MPASGARSRWSDWLPWRKASNGKRSLVALADSARDARRFEQAADLYRQLLEQRPDAGAIWLQFGHMLKESGQYDGAEEAYQRAQQLRRDDPEVALQLGHFYDLTDAPARAEAAYRDALGLRPGWADAKRSLEGVMRRQQYAVEDWADGLIPDLVASPQPPVRVWQPGLVLHRAGMPETGRWGTRRTLRGVQAVRGFLISEAPISRLGIWSGATKLFEGPVSSNAWVVQDELGSALLNKAVFNVWVDCSGLAMGPSRLVLRFTGRDGAMAAYSEDIVIAESIFEADYPYSDTLVSIDPADPDPVEQQIRGRPSAIRPARRSLFPDGIRSILILRTDQLGDMVASVPALRRLREIAPEARICALLTGANVQLAHSLNLFDELIEIDFPDDFAQRKRVMPLMQQQALRQKLASYAFDVAMDFAPSHVSRDLLLLSGAKFTHGFGGDWPWLQGRLDFATPDRWNGRDVAPHSTKPLSLVEMLGTLIRHEVETIRRPDLLRSTLAPLGLDDASFFVIHTGARLRFSRWPDVAALAERLARETKHIVVVIDLDGFIDGWPGDLVHTGRIRVLREALPFDTFDALLSFAEVVVGNDSGPKHLAALRGTPVVTLFSARINWSEWGQEHTGTIISRRVPCAGCAIFHDDDECGKDFACIRDIRVDEVFQAVTDLIGPPLAA